jgi:hypothetical protein
VEVVHGIHIVYRVKYGHDALAAGYVVDVAHGLRDRLFKVDCDLNV